MDKKRLTYTEFLKKLKRLRKISTSKQKFDLLDQNIKTIRRFKDYSIFDTGSVPVNVNSK